MIFKPMLAGKCEDLSLLRYPLMVSPKFDGVRATKVNGVLVSRTLKPIPSPHAHIITKLLPNGVDGELIVGNPWQDPYRATVSEVMRHDSDTERMAYYIFDNYLAEGGFIQRYATLGSLEGKSQNKPADVRIVPHIMVFNELGLLDKEKEFVDKGYEGLMIRSIDGPYKYGRSTENEGYLLKLKRFQDSEAEVLSVYEQMHNENEAETNALGRTERSTKKEGMVPAGVLGGFNARDIHTGADVRIGGGFLGQDPLINPEKPELGTEPSEYSRETLWRIRKTLPGRIAKYKFFPSGSKDRPRFPIFEGWRDKIDI
jgi:ATP-dependent DNA ligase